MCVVNFNDNMVEEADPSLPLSFRFYGTLRKLYLNSNEIGVASAGNLAKGLKCCTSLEKLLIRSNKSDIRLIAETLSQYCTHLKVLDMGDNPIGSSGLYYALCVILEHCPTLQELDVSFCINPFTLEYVNILQGLKYGTNLTKLNISKNCLGSDRTICVFEGLKHCTNLSELHAANNFLHDTKAQSLVDYLKHCPNLSVLDISYNEINDEVTSKLAEDLKDLHTFSYKQ